MTARLLPSRRTLRMCLLPIPLLLLLGVPQESGLIVQFGEPARVEAAHVASALVVVGADATVEGSVRDLLVVVDGRADVSGTILGDVVVVDGELALAPGARVAGDVTLFGSTFARGDGSVVAGAVQRDPTLEIGRAAALFWWTSTTLALLALALGVVALFGLRPRAVEAGRAVPSRAALAGLAVVLAAPLLAVLAFMTGLGLGIGLLILVALPGLFLAGYVVAGITLGAIALDRLQPAWAAQPWAPYLAAALGVVALQVLWVIPFFGLASVLAAMAGVGALVLAALRARRHVADQWGVRSETPPELSVT